jgi:hypothetical protein
MLTLKTLFNRASAFVTPLVFVSFAMTATAQDQDVNKINEDVKATAPAAAPAAQTASNAAPPTAADDNAVCLESVNLTVRPENRARLKAFCSRAARVEACASHEGRTISHVDALSSDSRGKRILVFGLIHGDEPLAGEMALEWAERLRAIPARNSWRVVPLLNPDGLRKKTRTNARGVDLNRNFPTSDWERNAKAYWKTQGKGDPRRFPGDESASEAETKCAMAEIQDFKPDFIVSVHTPYHVLDFDGPKMTFPAYKDLPWRALGNFPGSLGRYMWVDGGVPVLTVELGTKMVDAAKLQDILGSFVINAIKAASNGKSTAATREAASIGAADYDTVSDTSASR